MAETKDMLQEDYGMPVNKTTTRNPQANAILERIHQTIGNMMRTNQTVQVSISYDPHLYDTLLGDQQPDGSWGYPPGGSRFSNTYTTAATATCD